MWISSSFGRTVVIEYSVVVVNSMSYIFKCWLVCKTGEEDDCTEAVEVSNEICRFWNDDWPSPVRLTIVLLAVVTFVRCDLLIVVIWLIEFGATTGVAGISFSIVVLHFFNSQSISIWKWISNSWAASNFAWHV